MNMIKTYFALKLLQIDKYWSVRPTYI